MTAAEALRGAIVVLRGAGVDDPVRDARKLLAHAVGIAPDRLTLHLPEPLAADQRLAYERMIAARAARQPVSQITGSRGFYGRAFVVSGDTLDPRPETETLIEVALQQPFARVLDLGTGTGCILLTLLAERAAAVGLGTDLSAGALDVARRNAGLLGLAGRAEFVQANWFGGIVGGFDLIVSNPPYITEAEMAELAPEVRDWEPHLALTPGGDGLGAYRAIAGGAAAHLADGGRVVVEIGAGQGADVVAIFAQAGFGDTGIAQDLDGRDRVVTAAK
ncbi:MAG: peptide chain release factor N(5)-glutamine methyltransferase [Albidovulum sp.]